MKDKVKKSINTYYFEENEEGIKNEIIEEDEKREKIILTNKKILEKQKIKGKYIVQGLRSGSNWSMGLNTKKTEKSIHTAYLDLIKKAEKFIYIENQFFISSTADSKLVKNTIVDTIAKRIIKAIDKKENFIVYILIPLLPGFGGNIVKKDGQLLRIQIEWHLNTIFKSENSLIKQIEKKGVNWKKYIKIFGLRNHTIINGKPKSEIVYVHSKLIIIDDRYALLGSANINDRSMNGNRDSELAVVIESSNLEEGFMDGKIFLKAKKIKEFRIEAFRSMFEIEIYKGRKLSYEDPFDEIFIEAVEKQTRFNEEFYWNVFGFFPHDSLKTLEMIEEMQKSFKVNEKYYYENRHKVVGFAQPYPVRFLENEKNLATKFLDLGTTLLPSVIFT